MTAAPFIPRHFASDNYSGICPEAWAAMQEANTNHEISYGNDTWTQRAADLLRDIGMHIVAAVPRPQGVSASEIPAAVVDKERKFRVEQAMESGKPKEIAEKMVEGQMRKFFEEIALLEQPYIKDPSKKVKEVIGSGGTVVAFARWQVGEQA